MEVAITKMSSKGQVVIPAELRAGFAVGEKIIVIKDKGRLIMKRARDAEENFDEDLKFAARTEVAYKKYEKGEFNKLSAEEFLKEMAKW